VPSARPNWPSLQSARPCAVLLPESFAGRVTPSAPAEAGLSHARRLGAKNLSQAQPQVKRLRSGEGCEPQPGERAAAAGVLDAGPGERRVEVVAAVHVPGA